MFLVQCMYFTSLFMYVTYASLQLWFVPQAYDIIQYYYRFLRRNLQTPNRQIKANAFKALVRPHVEYCSTVWNPHTQDQIKKIEAVQRRGARFVCSRYGRVDSVTDMIRELEWESLESRRIKTQLTYLYKIIHNHIDIPPDPYIQPGHSRTRSNHSYKFQHISASTNSYKFSFFPHTIPIWNSLPARTAEAPSLLSFKRELAHSTF